MTRSIPVTASASCVLEKAPRNVKSYATHLSVLALHRFVIDPVVGGFMLDVVSCLQSYHGAVCLVHHLFILNKVRVRRDVIYYASMQQLSS